MAGVCARRGRDGDDAQRGDERDDERCELGLGVTCHVSDLPVVVPVPELREKHGAVLANLEVLTSTHVSCVTGVTTPPELFISSGQRVERALEAVR
jgi:hypothetical protein